MVRLLGFVALLALVVLVLLWSAEHFTPKGPAPEKAVAPAPEIQQPIPRPAPARETPPPASPEVAVADPGKPPPPATAPDREAPAPPSDAAAAAEASPEAPTGRPAEALAENQAGAGTGDQAEAGADEAREADPASAQGAARAIPAPASVDDRRTDPAAAQDNAPEAVTVAAEARDAGPAAAQNLAAASSAPAQDAASAPAPPPPQRPVSPSSPTSEPAPASGSSPEGAAAAAQPAGSDLSEARPPRAQESGGPAPRPTTPAAADQPQAAGARIEERLIEDEEFVALEQAQGRIDERTDAQRRRQEEDGWYGWGVLNEYADPDRAARLLGGTPVVRTGDRFHTVREQSGQIRVRPIGNVSAAYGAVGLRAHDPAFKQRVRRAIASGLLLGRESDHELLHLFPRREAAHLGNKVVQVFECHLRESGLSGEAADRFREQAKLRGAVVALRRANGGRLGVLLPRYFRAGEGRVPVASPCREIDDESRRAAVAMAAHPAGRPAPAGG